MSLYTYKKAFTLAEVLITLMILGVIATVTIPALIKNQQEKIAVTRLKSAYSTFSQAHTRAIADNGTADTWDFGDTGWNKQNSNKLYNYYKPYLNRVKDCAQSKGCFAQNYTALFSQQSYIWQPEHDATNYAKGKLANGVSFAIYANSKNCPNSACGDIYLDINGNDSPNKIGHDYFVFVITPDRIKPLTGANRCKYKDTSTSNGESCAKWVLEHGNMDYKYRDVSSEW